MSKRKDSDKAAPAVSDKSAAAMPANSAAVPGPEVSTASSAPVKAEAPVTTSLEGDTCKLAAMPQPVEAALQAVGAIQAAELTAPPAPGLEAAQAPAAAITRVEAPDAVTAEIPAAAVATESRSGRFALLAASVALASAVGAMAGALATSALSQPKIPAQAPVAAVDLGPMQKSIANLRSELAAIKSSVESGSRNTNAQFTKFTERLERIDRAQAAPAAQLKQAIEAIERLERHTAVQNASALTTGSVAPQQVAATPAPEPPRPQFLEGWVVRQVSRGVAVIQGRRMGLIEVETGDIVPGVGRIESIRRQDGRWVVVTSKGLIRSSALNTPVGPLPR
jgi:hypothetical protein